MEEKTRIEKILEQAVRERASDVFIVAGIPVSFRKNGVIHMEGNEKVFPAQTEELLREIYRLADRDIRILTEKGDDDFSLAIPGFSRFRVCAYKQRGALSAVMRIISRCTMPRKVLEGAQYTTRMKPV